LLQPVVHLLGDEIGRAGHRADENGDGEAHDPWRSAVKALYCMLPLKPAT
jgi:hypothetical protein